MIAKKVFIADGDTNRFLSDFIIRSSNYARPYVYIYDNTLASDGSEDVLQDGTVLQTNWVYPTNIWKRGGDAPKSEDLTTVDKWQVVDNSILYFDEPTAGTTVWIEVATTAEEFGDTLLQPTVAEAVAAADAAKASADAALVSETTSTANAVSTAADVAATNADVVITNADAVSTAADAVSTAADAVSTALDVAATNADVLLTNADVVITNADAVSTALDVAATNADVLLTNSDVLLTNADVVSSGINATNAQLFEWEAEAERLTADSYATEAEDVFVNIVTSDGDGTFTYTPTTEYSSLHWAAKAEASSNGDAADISIVDAGGYYTGTEVETALQEVGADLLLRAVKSNVLELDNTTPFTPDADYEPATKKYVDDSIPSISPRSWSVVTGSRLVATEYTNSSGNEMEVLITKGGSSDNAFSVDSVIIGRMNDSTGNNETAQFTVPNGSTYELSGGSITVWSELS